MKPLPGTQPDPSMSASGRANAAIVIAVIAAVALGWLVFQ